MAALTHGTRIAWILNLDADRELQDPEGYRPLEVASDAWRTRTADLVAPEDVILTGNNRAVRALPEGHVVQCFCPTPSALGQLASWGLAVPQAPALATLRKVNDRAFSAELGQCLPGASFVRDLATLEQQLTAASPSGVHVVKRAFSFAGREQRRIQGGELDASTRGFCERSFARGQGVQLEPWLERLGDFSRHGYLSRHGGLQIGPTREQRCDALGRFLSVALGPAAVSDAEADAFAAELQRTAAALSGAGYFGPFGIDGFRYRLPDGTIALNPRCEINARFTMGYPRALLLAALTR
jgi:hypothetical protein